MKKLVSAALVLVLFAALAVSVFAEEPISVEPRTITHARGYGWITELFIDDPGDYIITHDVDVSVLRIVDVENAVLTIPEGVTVVVRSSTVIDGTVELLGTLDVSQCFTVKSEYLDRIHVGETGNLIKKEEQSQQQGTVLGKTIITGSDSGDYHLGSALSGGSLTVIVGVAAAVVFGFGGFFIGKTVEKKKKPALASGENKDEE